MAHVFRHPLQVVRSLQKRDPCYTMAEGLLLWLDHVLEACRSTQDDRVSWVEFDSLLKEPAVTLSAVADELGIRWPVEGARQGAVLKGALKPGLRHYDARDLTYPERGLYEMTQRVYRALQARECGEDAPEVFAGKINAELSQLRGYSSLAQELRRGPKRALEDEKASAAHAIRHRDDVIAVQQEQIAVQQEQIARFEAAIHQRDEHIALLREILNDPLRLIRRLGRLVLNRLTHGAWAPDAPASVQDSAGGKDRETSSDARGGR